MVITTVLTIALRLVYIQVHKIMLVLEGLLRFPWGDCLRRITRVVGKFFDVVLMANFDCLETDTEQMTRSKDKLCKKYGYDFFDCVIDFL